MRPCTQLTWPFLCSMAQIGPARTGQADLELTHIQHHTAAGGPIVTVRRGRKGVGGKGSKLPPRLQPGRTPGRPRLCQSGLSSVQLPLVSQRSMLTQCLKCRQALPSLRWKLLMLLMPTPRRPQLYQLMKALRSSMRVQGTPTRKSPKPKNQGCRPMSGIGLGSSRKSLQTRVLL